MSAPVFNMVGGGGGGKVLRLIKIEITRVPNKTTYSIGDIFDPSGMVVVATYGYGAAVITDTVTSYSCPTTPLVAADTSVTISYSEGGVTKTAAVSITVAKRSIPRPAQVSIPTYTGIPQSPNLGDDFSAAVSDGFAHVISGSTSESEAGTYSATYALLDPANSQWDDGSVSNKTVSWTIHPATISVVPAQSNTLTYTGGAQSPTWSNFAGDSDTKMQIDTGNSTLSATAAGSYTVRFVARPNYAWRSGNDFIYYKEVSWSIGQLTISGDPAQSGSLTYDGTQQSPSWNSAYDSNKLTLGGVTQATDAGDYYATFTPKGNYKWSDGTNSAHSVKWTIGRAPVTLPAQSGTLTYTGNSQSPSWNSNYVAAKMTLSGVTSGTDAKSYTAKFTPTNNYKWADNDGTTARDVTWSIGKASISTVPTQSGSLTYTGSQQSPSWNNFNSNQLTVTGNTGTNAKSYTATFTPTANYKWSDDSANKTAQWTIGKASGSLSLSPTTLSFGAAGQTQNIAVNRAGDGAITAKSSNTNVATVTVTGTTVKVTAGSTAGSATITVSVAAGTNHNKPSDATATATLTLSPAVTTLGGTFSFAGKQWMTVHVESDRIYACTVDIPSTTTFGSNNTYAGSTLASVAKTFEDNLSADDKAKLLNVTVNGVTAKVFVPSYEQVFTGTGHFDHFSNGTAADTKRVAKYNGAANWWWTSSPYSGSYVYSVFSDGSINGYSPGSTYGFRPFVAFKR